MRQTQSVCPGTSLLMAAVAAGVLRDVSWQRTKMGLSTASALISPTLEYWWSVGIYCIYQEFFAFNFFRSHQY